MYWILLLPVLVMLGVTRLLGGRVNAMARTRNPQHVLTYVYVKPTPLCGGGFTWKCSCGSDGTLTGKRRSNQDQAVGAHKIHVRAAVHRDLAELGLLPRQPIVSSLRNKRRFGSLAPQA